MQISDDASDLLQIRCPIATRAWDECSPRCAQQSAGPTRGYRTSDTQARGPSSDNPAFGNAPRPSRFSVPENWAAIPSDSARLFVIFIAGSDLSPDSCPIAPWDFSTRTQYSPALRERDANDVPVSRLKYEALSECRPPTAGATAVPVSSDQPNVGKLFPTRYLATEAAER
jgi:hypothetical protein